MSVQTDPALREHPNRVDWNARYERAGSAHAPFAPVPWLADVLRAGVPDGPVLELASGRSGTALALAAQQLGTHGGAVLLQLEHALEAWPIGSTSSGRLGLLGTRRDAFRAGAQQALLGCGDISPRL
ncbi:Putative methyltransferase [Mycobacterium tuberculosis CAS/NITR204]|uniref:Putative methyltransferase n=1 Tax=Mycobacterium tuberculosis CAS/NITR204 TaxID=1310114 RepID=R4MAN1_MYCTX|nr:Putative methyltransferase [Mycobacterium tuberculosis CAS/NITR204]